MALNKYFGIVFICGILFSSCDFTEGEEQDAGVTVSADTLSAGKSWESYSPNFKKLVKSDSGTFRGIYAGMLISEVKMVEDSLHVEEQGKDYVDYIINYNFPETAEVIYTFNRDSIITQIVADVYPRDEESQKVLYTEFINFYTTKLGSPTKTDNTKTVWENKDQNLRVSMEKKDNDKVHDLHLEFKPIGKEPLSNL